MDTHIVNTLERRLGMDLNGDGFVGGEGYLSMLERATGRDINGDGVLGRRPDVLPGYPAVYGHPSMVYNTNGQVYATNNYVGSTYPQQFSSYGHHHSHQYGHQHGHQHVHRRFF